MTKRDVDALEANRDRLAGRALWWLEVFMDARHNDEFALREIRVTFRGVGRYTVMLKGIDSEGRQHVAWHDASDVRGGIVGALNRFRQNELKWHGDKFQKGYEG